MIQQIFVEHLCCVGHYVVCKPQGHSVSQGPKKLMFLGLTFPQTFPFITQATQRFCSPVHHYFREDCLEIHILTQKGLQWKNSRHLGQVVDGEVSSGKTDLCTHVA